MINVNLLPYRIEERRRSVAHFIYLVSVTVAILFSGVFVTYFQYSSQLDDVVSEFQHLRKENKKMANLIGEVANIDSLRDEVKAKLDVIKLLQKGRYYSFSKLGFISKSKPEKVWINYIKDDGDNIYIRGYAISSEDVSDFMRNLESNVIFDSVNLKLVSNNTVGKFDNQVIYYELEIVQKYKDSDIEASMSSDADKSNKNRGKSGKVKAANK